MTIHLPPATPCIGFESATSMLECCWSCQCRLIPWGNLPTVLAGRRDIGLCLNCEREMLP